MECLAPSPPSPSPPSATSLAAPPPGAFKVFQLRRKEVSLLFSARKKGLYGYSNIHGQVIKREINQIGFWFLGSLKPEVKLWQWFVLVSWLTLSPVLSLKDFLRLCTGKYRLQFQFWIFCLFSSKYLIARALGFVGKRKFSPTVADSEARWCMCLIYYVCVVCEMNDF